jgi:hypothetical protein
MADVMTTAKNKIQEAGNSAAQAANSAANTTAEGVRNAANYVADQAKELANNASKGVACAGSFLDTKADEATHALGGGLKAAGDAIRQNAPHDGRIGQASSAVAQGLADTGDYIEREGVKGIGNDLVCLIKRNPIPALLVGIGLGFLVARASSPRA